MLIRLGYEMVFDLPAPAPMVLVLDTRPQHDAAIRRPGGMRVVPDVPVHRYVDAYGNLCTRIVAPAGRVTIWDDLVVEDSGLPDPVAPGAIQHRIEDLPNEVLVYLLPSRHCEVDRLANDAWRLFGQAPPGWSRVRAICEWVNANVVFGYGTSHPSKTAYEVFKDGKGVCRDMNHLALTFCRAMNIPARYATGYLGDIGIPLSVNPMDFSGWFEVYLGGTWHAQDARNLPPRIGRILMGYGRDAVDVALTTTFGVSQLRTFTVWTDEVGPWALGSSQGIPKSLIRTIIS